MHTFLTDDFTITRIVGLYFCKFEIPYSINNFGLPMYKKIFFSLVIILSTTNTFAEKISKKQLEKQTLVYMNKMDEIGKNVENSKGEIVPLIQHMCELRKVSTDFSKFLNEQSTYYPEIKEIDAQFMMDNLLADMNKSLAYKDTTICEVLDF